MPENYARIMHTPQNIMHGDHARIMHGRATDYARVRKDYAEVFAILFTLPQRAPRLCTDYAHATKYYARRLCTNYARARHGHATKIVPSCLDTRKRCRVNDAVHNPQSALKTIRA